MGKNKCVILEKINLEKMTKSKDKIIYISKPSIGYYLLIISFPIIFFLTDDSKKLIFEHWEASTSTYLINCFGLFIFFGIPILLILLSRKLILYMDRIIVCNPIFKINKIYFLKDIVEWESVIYFGRYVAGQNELKIKFKNKNFNFNKIELSNYENILKYLEINFPEKRVK